MSAVLAAGLILLSASAAVDLGAGTRWRRLMAVPYLLGATGSGCLAAAGAGVLAGHPARLAVGGWLGSGTLGIQTLGLVADRLSGLFLLISFTAAVGVSLAFANWAARPAPAARVSPGQVTAERMPSGRTLVGRRGLGASYALALGAVAVFMTATDAFTALFAWEALTVAFYLLAGLEQGQGGRPEGAFITLVFGRISGAALLLGLLLLAVRSHSLSLSSFTHVQRRYGPGRRRGTAVRRLRCEGRASAVPGVDAARVPGRTRPGPGDHGRGGGQRRVLRAVAHLQPVGGAPPGSPACCWSWPG